MLECEATQFGIGKKSFREDSCLCPPSSIRRVITGTLLLVKGKAIPLQAWTGPEGFRRLRLLDFKIIGT